MSKILALLFIFIVIATFWISANGNGEPPRQVNRIQHVELRRGHQQHSLNGRIQRHKRQSALRVIPWILAPHIMVIATVADDIRKRSNKKNAE